MDKALKEAKVHTSWINPNDRHDQAVRDFVASILEPGGENAFLGEFSDFVAPIAKAGLFNSLSQLLLKVASPGLPDFYQGCEMWDFSLVDRTIGGLWTLPEREPRLQKFKRPARNPGLNSYRSYCKPPKTAGSNWT